jgi:hypothetical protein
MHNILYLGPRKNVCVVAYFVTLTPRQMGHFGADRNVLYWHLDLIRGNPIHKVPAVRPPSLQHKKVFVLSIYLSDCVGKAAKLTINVGWLVLLGFFFRRN